MSCPPSLTAATRSTPQPQEDSGFFRPPTVSCAAVLIPDPFSAPGVSPARLVGGLYAAGETVKVPPRAYTGPSLRADPP